MKKRSLHFKKTLIILFSLSLIALLSYLISFAFFNNSVTSNFGLINHDAVVAIKAGEAVSPPPITEQDWFVPVIASCVGLFALCIILGLGIGIPIAKKKEKKLLAERRENEALMQKIQEVSEEEAALAEQQKTEELNNKENIQESQEVKTEDNHNVGGAAGYYPAANGAPGQPTPPIQMNPNFRPGQQPNIQPFGANRVMPNQQIMPGNVMQQRPGFNPALMNSSKPSGSYPQMINRQQPGFVNNQQRFNNVAPGAQQRPMQQQMPFNQRPGSIAPGSNQQQMRPLPQQGGYGPVAARGAVPLHNVSGQQPQQFGPRPMPQR